ncbi:MAG: 6,7-dimethyl-8-ribityllumazine synthase [Acidobacteria bacterium]|nr:6,7-dimethyl-8-ribityllumazine synthase [Acidobacteriota bacterium]
MSKVFEGQLQAAEFYFGIIVSRYNSMITGRLLDGALDALKRTGAAEEHVHIFRVPGSFEIPLLAKRLATMQKYDAVICLGALVRGETPHFEYISAEVTKGIAQVSLDSGLPITYGIITADTVEQAINRAGLKSGNKGFEAAMTAVEMVNLLKSV